MPLTDCGRCHSCGGGLDSDEWCPACRAFRRYASHGWATPDADCDPCDASVRQQGLR